LLSERSFARFAFSDIEFDVSCTYRIKFMFFFLQFSLSPDPKAKQKEKSMFEKHNTSVRGEKRHNIGKRRAFLKFFEFHTRLSGLKKASTD
jgi:hypothetical protein